VSEPDSAEAVGGLEEAFLTLDLDEGRGAPWLEPPPPPPVAFFFGPRLLLGVLGADFLSSFLSGF
jgi:hypothetical protein